MMEELITDCDLPTCKLTLQIPSGTKPVVLVACGSFSPPTLMHLRMMEDAKDTLNSRGYTCIGGLISPVHMAYGKETLASAEDRLEMTKLAVASSNWLMAYDWEVQQEGWTRTALVLEHVHKQLRQHVKITVQDESEEVRGAEVMLMCGADLLETFTHKGVWLESDQTIILRRGLACIYREGTDIDAVIRNDEKLAMHKDRIIFVKTRAVNNISSSVVRELLREGASIKYLVPDAVEAYIASHNLAALPQWQK